MHPSVIASAYGLTKFFGGKRIADPFFLVVMVGSSDSGLNVAQVDKECNIIIRRITLRYVPC
jgi:hypothetical protein